MVYTELGQIAASHPSLPGHFPGDPIVPGVVILQRVLKAAARSFGAVTGVTVAKFHSRLKPDEQFKIELERGTADALNFRVLRGETLISGGILKLPQ